MKVHSRSMADQPSQTPNSGRISAMLQDLASARQKTPADQPRSAQPVPGNLPVRPAPASAPPIAPRPIPQAAPIPRAPVVPPTPAVPRIPTPPQPTPPAVRSIPTVPTPPRPTIPQPPILNTDLTTTKADYSSELRTMTGDISQIQVGRPPSGIQPVVPIPPSPAVVTPLSSLPITPAAPIITPSVPGPNITVPPAQSSTGGGRKILIGLVILGIVAITTAIVSSMFLGGEEETPSPTPTPSSTITLSPQGKNLRSYFGAPRATASLNPGSELQDVKNFILTTQTSARQATGIEIQRSGSSLSSTAFLDATVTGLPADLRSSITGDWMALIYGQAERYDRSTGQLSTNAGTENRLILVFEISNASQATQSMEAWEANGLTVALQGLFGFDQAEAIVPAFSSGTYRNIPVRYWNFPYADRALDWSIALASNGKSYLLLSGSRESLFFAIDQVMQ